MAEKSLQEKIADERKEKRFEQRQLEKTTKIHAPKGTKKAYLRFRAVLAHAIAESVKRIKVLRKRRQAQHAAKRGKILDYCRWGAAHESSIHYEQRRPIDGLTGKDQKTLPLYTDCSGFATKAYKHAGAPDPNGFGFNGFGFTGSMYEHCQRIPQSKAKVGDLVEFGGYPGSHVVVLMDDGSKADPICMSHGQESGPSAYPLSVQKSAHAGQSVNFLRVPGLD